MLDNLRKLVEDDERPVAEPVRVDRVITNATEALDLYRNLSRSPSGERDEMLLYYGVKPGA